MTRNSKFSAGRPVRLRWLRHLLLTICFLAIAGPVGALPGARMQVDAQQTYDSTSHDYDGVTTTGHLHPHDGEDGHDAVYDGVTHLFAGMVDARADPGWRNAARGGSRGADDLGTIFVDSKGNAIPTPKGGSITGSPDGRFNQARDAAGRPTGVRIGGPHNPATHPDPRAQAPHGHVPGVTNPDGTPWLPIKQ